MESKNAIETLSANNAMESKNVRIQWEAQTMNLKIMFNLLLHCPYQIVYAPPFLSCKVMTPYIHITTYANWIIGHRIALDCATRLRGVMTWHVLYC